MTDYRDTIHQYRIPQTSDVPFEPRLLVHRVLSVRPSSDATKWPAQYSFFAVERDQTIPDGFDIDAYVQGVAASPTDVPAHVVPPGPSPDARTPWDINPAGQCYLVLELDHRMNWEFLRGSRAVASKKFFPGENSNLVLVDTAGQLYGPGEDFYVPDETCLVLYFHVVERRPEPGPCGTVARSFNFLIDFLSDGAEGRTLHLPTIFDPNVPNTGGAGIPG